jgi:hypothetical protein
MAWGYWTTYSSPRQISNLNSGRNSRAGIISLTPSSGAAAAAAAAGAATAAVQQQTKGSGSSGRDVDNYILFIAKIHFYSTYFIEHLLSYFSSTIDLNYSTARQM